MSTKILAQRYNALQSRIQPILGNPIESAPNTGYGQTLSSSQVAAGTSKVSAIDYTKIVSDMSKARYHQIGSLFGGVDPVIPVGVNRQKVLEAYIIELENLIPLIEADKDLYSPSQMTLENLKTSLGVNVSSSRTALWTTQIFYTFDVIFSSLEHYRSYFNTGGEIRFVTESTYSGGEAKSNDWKTALAYISTLRFTPTQTIAAGGAITVSTGGRTITSGQNVTLVNYVRGTGVYSANTINIQVTRISNTTLRFTVRLTDGPGNVDESVRGPITTTVSTFRANGNLSNLTVAAPVGVNVANY